MQIPDEGSLLWEWAQRDSVTANLAFAMPFEMQPHIVRATEVRRTNGREHDGMATSPGALRRLFMRLIFPHAVSPLGSRGRVWKLLHCQVLGCH